MAPLSWRGRNGNTPQIACKVTVYKVDSAYKVGFCWNQIILGIFIVIIDLILSIYNVACKVGRARPLLGWKMDEGIWRRSAPVSSMFGTQIISASLTTWFEREMNNFQRWVRFTASNRLWSVRSGEAIAACQTWITWTKGPKPRGSTNPRES